MTAPVGYTVPQANLDELVPSRETFSTHDLIAALHNQEVVDVLKTQTRDQYMAASDDPAACHAAESVARYTQDQFRPEEGAYIETDTNLAHYDVNDNSQDDRIVLSGVSVNRGAYVIHQAWNSEDTNSELIVGSGVAKRGYMNAITYEFSTTVSEGRDRETSCQLSVDPTFTTNNGDRASSLFYLTCDNKRIEKKLEEDRVDLVNGLRTSLGLEALSNEDMMSLVAE